MEAVIRKPFQGVTNIIRFNWHYYLILFILMAGAGFGMQYGSKTIRQLMEGFLILGSVSILISLGVSCYIYDYSSFYSLAWLDSLGIKPGDRLVNIHAGFDEISGLLACKYPGANLTVYDFYDPVKHTEVSIKRARKAYPEFPGTQKIDSSASTLPQTDNNYILLVLSAHEIRNQDERIEFFITLRTSLMKNGKMVVVEHQRDLANFISYSMGFLHFISPKSWERTFEKSCLKIDSMKKLTAFITVYILIHDGTAS